MSNQGHSSQYGHSRSRQYKSSQPTSSSLPGVVNALRRAGQLLRAVEGEGTGTGREGGALDQWDLTWPQFDTLLAIRELSEEGPLGVRAAIEKVGSGAFRRIEHLEEKGLVTKDPHPDDARKKVLRLTSGGEAALSQALLRLEDIQITPAPAPETTGETPM